MPDHPENYPSPPNPDDGPQSQEIQHQQVSALVPEHVAAGVFSTGAVVLHGHHEFIIDFLLRMQRPQQVAARIILPPTVMPQFIKALQENLSKFETRFGTVPKAPTPLDQPQPPQQQTSAQELYDQLKIHDTVMSGDYANAVMIGHTPTEFSFDFITTFFPRSAVARRVYLAVPNAQRLLESLTHSFKQFEQRRNNPPGGQTGPGMSPPPPPPEGPPGTFDGLA